MKLLLSFFIAASLWAGQSLNGGSFITATVPVYSTASSFTLEYFGHGINPATASGRWVRAKSFGIDPYISANTFIVNAFNTDATGFSEGNLATLFPDGAIAVRITKDASINTIRLEMWDQNGVRKIASTRTYTTQNSDASAEMNFREDGSLGGLAFVRVKNYAVAANSRPPTTYDADAGIAYEWKFDGNLTASVGGVNATGTSPTYQNPSLYQLAYANAQANPTEWASWTSLRAGVPQTLASNSYSQADASNDVTCAWNQISGPSRVIFSNPNTCSPTITGHIFGTYSFRLVVVDAASNTSSTTLTVGSVATDSNGVVIHSNADVDKLFGPMIAYGKNPWGWADEAHHRAMTLRSAVYDASWPRDWRTNLTGTVSYNGTQTTAKGTLNGNINSTTETIVLNGGHSADFTQFPTLIAFGIPGYSEYVLVCGISTNTLTVCPGGRGFLKTTAASHNNGDSIYQNKISGASGTTFLTDFCTAGAVSPQGNVTYSTGTMTLTAGSTTVTGSGTTWNTANGVVASENNWVVRVSATHSGGQPFTFISAITAVNSTTQLTLKTAFPSAGDTGSYSYQVIQLSTKFIAPKWGRPDATTGQTYFGLTMCMSDSHAYWDGGFEVVSGAQNTKEYAGYRALWFTSGGNGDPNFYDEALASYALYFRSGLTTALDAARKLVPYIDNPQIDEGWSPGTFPRNKGITGNVAAAVLDGQTSIWYGLRKLADSGVSAISAPCTDELRENTYQLSWLSLAAMFDPDGTEKANWQSELANAYTTHDNVCKGANNGFYSAIWASNGPWSVTNGDDTVTGTGINADVCQRTAGGTGTVTNGGGTLEVVTGTPVPGGRITITGTRSGSPYMTLMEFSVSGSTVSLGGAWIGDGGTVNWQTQSDGAPLVISNDNVPGNSSYQALHACTWVSSTEITLDRNWEGPTDSTAYFYRSRDLGLAGNGVQPFIGGIKAYQMHLASQGATGSTATNYATLRDGLATFVIENGYDPVTGGMFYGRGYPQCEPTYGQGAGFFQTRQSGCSYASTNLTDSHGLLAEGQGALRFWYEAAPTVEKKAIGDTFYANQWGYKWTTDGVTTGTWNNDFAGDDDLSGGKWYGFQFGIGMAHQWPAVRLGGVAAADTRTVTLSYVAPAGTSATSATYVAPSGASSTISCSAGACSLPTDWRQGNYLYKLTHTVTGGTVAGDLVPLVVQ